MSFKETQLHVKKRYWKDCFLRLAQPGRVRARVTSQASSAYSPHHSGPCVTSVKGNFLDSNYFLHHFLHNLCDFSLPCVQGHQSYLRSEMNSGISLSNFFSNTWAMPPVFQQDVRESYRSFLNPDVINYLPCTLRQAHRSGLPCPHLSGLNELLAAESLAMCLGNSMYSISTVFSHCFLFFICIQTTQKVSGHWVWQRMWIWDCSGSLFVINTKT